MRLTNLVHQSYFVCLQLLYFLIITCDLRRKKMVLYDRNPQRNNLIKGWLSHSRVIGEVRLESLLRIYACDLCLHVSFCVRTLFSSLSRCVLSDSTSTSSLLSFPLKSFTSRSLSDNSLLQVSYSC